MYTLVALLIITATPIIWYFVGIGWLFVLSLFLTLLAVLWGIQLKKNLIGIAELDFDQKALYVIYLAVCLVIPDIVGFCIIGLRSIG